MELEKSLNEYLEKIEKYLKPLIVSERVDIVKEIKSEMLELKMLSIRVTKGKPLVTLIFLSKEREINNESYEQRGRMGRSKQDFSDRL